MKKEEKLRILEEILDTVREKSERVLDTAPENWDGHEIRALVADVAARHARMSAARRTGARRREYENHMICTAW